MLSRLSILAVVVIGLCAVPQSGAHYIDLRGKLVEDGKLTLGLALTGPPFAYRVLHPELPGKLPYLRVISAVR